MGALKWISLIVMLIQNAITPIIFRYATTEAIAENRYDTATSVMFAELLKLIMSLLLIVVEEDMSLSRAAHIVRSEIFGKSRDTMKLAVPALLYFIQNQMLQLASSNLPAAVFQVMYQGKTLVVAIFSVILLQKRLSREKWFAIAIMGFGLAIVQLAKASESAQGSMANAAEQNNMLGLVYTLIGCVCTGFAGVYFEKMMKTPVQSGNCGQAPTKPPSIWVRNTQLAGFSIVMGIIQVILVKRSGLTESKRLLNGFTPKVWLMVTNNAIGGLCVAFVIKYADNILKGFACALATILAAIMAVPLFGFSLSLTFFLGMAIVISSTLIYGGTVKVPFWTTFWAEEPSLCKNLRNPEVVIDPVNNDDELGNVSLIFDDSRESFNIELQMLDDGNVDTEAYQSCRTRIHFLSEKIFVPI